MVFDYPAKGSIRRIVTDSDPDVLSLVRVLKRRRGGDGNLLAYQVDYSWSSVHSEDINAYIRQAAGGQYTAVRLGCPPERGAPSWPGSWTRCSYR
jgi:DNA topoisomerase-1